MPHSQDILINWTPQETRVAIIESGAVLRLTTKEDAIRFTELLLAERQADLDPFGGGVDVQIDKPMLTMA